MAHKKSSRKKNKNAPPEEIAAWMAKRFKKNGNELHQEDAAEGIKRRFGKKFVPETAAGGYSIDPTVREAFKKLTPDAVWEGGHQVWRERTTADDPNSRLAG